MTRHGGLTCAALILILGCFAALAPGIGHASGDNLPLHAAKPDQQRLEIGRVPETLRLKGTVQAQSGDMAGERKLFLVTRRSSLTAFQHIGSSTLPLVGKAGGNGNWFLLAGLSPTIAEGAGNEGPVSIGRSDGNALSDLYYTVEMYIIPSNRWSIRASLGFDSADIHDASIIPAQNLDPIHFGVAIAYDYGAQNPVVLDLGYARSSLEGRTASGRAGSGSPDLAQTGDDSSDAWVVSACLNIQF